ncbi:2-polyprenyl-6-methoxyphenol hydroxylase-like FAD-dependent oxidoreductase [Actinoplanes campanulatus]|uniref:2-polyprenyl-6-methoxyphenol hydroxylase-like FAD-dependent oxidoreductase n=1 Tax=Actinoplanes campanulatus TaxID=113559 RepID=A0A7W5ARY7_9ACTN|nr:FAD-dependent monooxygenase [Actinoplanes campanulatus]MBB3101342.1 2-polyprenyl-6-methoxyphenol hydroxylase-like FAD-dependent oxidoreductase [Actinoplanes campanulatus]GGN48384.1 2-polyprenyl-6-methoxyphenol hydroxylase [Actinoplanes campanulatus]GID41731.1 2-polyprenyl-6-methoxyphenol hydroxylase [Actinoplanes campanulatus]
MAELSCEVLVVGAGPTGLMLANWLTRLGVQVIVADGKDGPTIESRALIVQARSLEIYDQLGIGDQVLEAARRAEALAPGFGARGFGRIPLGPLGGAVTPYPYIEVLEQSRNEEILNENLQKLGGQVFWESPVTAVVQTEDGVEAKAGNHTVRARFCVGCDGANSMVRKARRIDFEGVTNPHRFFVLDATGAGGLQPDAINVRPYRDDFLLAFPMRGNGNWRLIGLVRDVDGDGALDEEDARARMLRTYGVTYDRSRWFATYRVHHRVAAAFRDGPFLLAGDAAHVHSPVGGQGMNTGLQDAHNLAFKLADVLRGTRKDGWLDRYEAERRPVARKLVATTDRVFGFLTSSRWPLRVLRRVAVPLLAPVGVRALPGSAGGSRLFQYVSQIRIHYRLDPAGTPGRRRDPVVGRRLPWADGNHAALRAACWQIHAYGGVTAADAPDLGVPVHVFPPAPATVLRPGLFYLVRPDGFVAARAEPAEADTLFRHAMAR